MESVMWTTESAQTSHDRRSWTMTVGHGGGKRAARTAIPEDRDGVADVAGLDSADAVREMSAMSGTGEGLPDSADSVCEIGQPL